MKASVHATLTALLIVGAGACGGLHEAMEGHQRVVARVNGYQLTVDHAAELLASASEGVAPPRTLVVDPLIDMWVGFTLLADAFARPDSFETVDLAPLIGLTLDQQLVWKLHRDVIESRAELPDAELRETYQREQPWAEVRASHILLRPSPSADDTERQRLRQQAEEIRRRILEGADFGALAREYSDDPSTASEGGDLGWVERGDLVPELDAVLFELPPDSVSDVIRSTVGYHIVRVTDRRSPEYDDVRENYRSEIANRRFQEAEAAYVDSLFERADPRFQADAASLARNLAGAPQLERLSPAMRRSTLVEYDGGALTVGEFADLVIRGTPNSRSAFAGSDTSRLKGMLRELVRNELLAEAAREAGYELTPSEVDSIRTAARQRIRLAATTVGLDRDELLEGHEAIVRGVDRVLTDVLTRQASPRPMERVAAALRRGQAISVYPSRFPDVVRRLIEIRGIRPDHADDESGPDPVEPTGGQ